MLWKAVGSLGAVLAVVISLNEVSQLIAWAEDIEQVRKETQQTFEALRQDMQRDARERRLDALQDQVWRFRGLVKQHPEDTELQQDLKDILRQKQELEKKLRGE